MNPFKQASKIGARDLQCLPVFVNEHLEFAAEIEAMKTSIIRWIG